MKKITITEFMDLPAVQSLQARFDVRYDPSLIDHPARLLDAVSDADAVIVRNRTQVRGPLLAAMGRVSVVGRLGVGLDNIDLAACSARNIRVIPATGANAQAVAEYVLGSAMLLLRGIYRSSAEVAAGDWPRNALSNGREIAGKTLGLVGFGSIGQCTARLAQALGLHVLAHDPALAADAAVWHSSGVSPCTLDQLLAQSDILSLHVPLVAQTQNLINAERIARMKPGAVLVNTARGGIADEAAVASALRSGQLGGAAFDVFEPEPLPAQNAWHGCPNLLLTPHVAGVTAEANQRVSTLIASQVAAALG